jgi:hypothetical protein
MNNSANNIGAFDGSIVIIRWTQAPFEADSGRATQEANKESSDAYDRD